MFVLIFADKLRGYSIDMLNKNFQRLGRLLGTTRILTIASLMVVQSLSAQSIWEGGDVDNGQALFNANCASCHLVTADVLAAPGLAGIADRWDPAMSCSCNGFKTPKARPPQGTGTFGPWSSVTLVPTDG